MATLAPRALRALADGWENGIDSAEKREDAATFAGIVGDLRHRLEGGYHISREDQPWSNYSIAQFSDDRLGPSNMAAAVDMTMITKDMILVTRRLVDAWHREDPRLANVRGFNGTLDGVNAIRKDAANPDPYTTDEATVDHTGHLHMELFRAFVEDSKTMSDILSVILGTTPEEGEVMIEQAYLDYLPDTAMAVLVGETPSLGYPDATGPQWDNVALKNHNLKVVETRLNARLDKLEAAIKAVPVPSVTAADIAKAIIAELQK